MFSASICIYIYMFKFETNIIKLLGNGEEEDEHTIWIVIIPFSDGVSTKLNSVGCCCVRDFVGHANGIVFAHLIGY